MGPEAIKEEVLIILPDLISPQENVWDAESDEVHLL